MLTISLNKIAPAQNDLIVDLYKARYIFHRAYFEEADRKFKELAVVNDNNPLIYAYLNMIDYMLFRPNELNVKQVEMNLKKDDPDYLFIKALLRFTQNDFKDAADLLERHIKKFPDDSFAKHTLGFCRTDNNQPAEGLEVLFNLIEDDPSYFPAYNHIGYAYMALNEYDSALIYLKKFVESDSLNPSAYDSYAEGLAGQIKYNDAIAQLTRAVLLEKEFAYGWRHIGDIFSKMSEPEFSLRAYLKAKENAGLYGEKFKNSIDKKIRLIKNKMKNKVN